MLAFNVVLAASAALSFVSAAPVARGQPKGWATGYLEDYPRYHTRYVQLNCSSQHDTVFFSECCSPLLADESLDTRPVYCTPTSAEIAAYNATATVSVSATASATATASSEDEDEYCSDLSSASSVAAQATSTSYDVESSSIYVAQAVATDAPSTSSTVEYIPSTTSTTPAAAATTAASSGGSVQTGGYATYFYQGGNAGACGTVHSDSDYVIAIDSNGWWSDYASNSASPYCGKSIVITNSNNGKSVTAVVADVCPSCTSDNSLDLSVGAFTAIASESDGMVPITWVWA